jgi:hypothetical protein
MKQKYTVILSKEAEQLRILCEVANLYFSENNVPAIEFSD